jgi:ionotropic glutamate receptor
MVTAKRFRLSVTDLDQLLKNGDYIGYQTVGFAWSFLMKKGIKEDRLNPYNNQKALSKGPKDDGGSATVDENPYFRSDNHSKTYDMVAVLV